MPRLAGCASYYGPPMTRSTGRAERLQTSAKEIQASRLWAQSWVVHELSNEREFFSQRAGLVSVELRLTVDVISECIATDRLTMRSSSGWSRMTALSHIAPTHLWDGFVSHSSSCRSNVLLGQQLRRGTTRSPNLDPFAHLDHHEVLT